MCIGPFYIQMQSLYNRSVHYTSLKYASPTFVTSGRSHANNLMVRIPTTSSCIRPTLSSDALRPRLRDAARRLTLHAWTGKRMISSPTPTSDATPITEWSNRVPRMTLIGVQKMSRTSLDIFLTFSQSWEISVAALPIPETPFLKFIFLFLTSTFAVFDLWPSCSGFTLAIRRDFREMRPIHAVRRNQERRDILWTLCWNKADWTEDINKRRKDMKYR